MAYLLIDIGGTKTRVAVSDDLETIKEKESFKTPAEFDPAIAQIAEAAKKLTGENKVKGAAVGIRGVMNEDHTGISNDSALRKWVGKSVVGALEKALDTQVFLENDTAIAAIGEANFGAGKGMEIVAYHTISTGVGGARVVDGVIDKAAVNFEPGHQIVDIDRTILGEDVKPTLENLVSGTGVANRMGVKAYEIPQSDVLWRDLAGYLGQGLRNTTLYWSPDVIVLGGSMITGDPRIEIDDIRKATVDALDGFTSCPHITMSKTVDEAGLYGAMAILKQRL